MKIIIAVVIVMLGFGGAVAGSYGLAIHAQDVNNQRLCSYLETVVPRTKAPSNSKKNPSREISYKFSVKTDQFEHSIGCRAN